MFSLPRISLQASDASPIDLNTYGLNLAEGGRQQALVTSTVSGTLPNVTQPVLGFIEASKDAVTANTSQSLIDLRGRMVFSRDYQNGVWSAWVAAGYTDAEVEALIASKADLDDVNAAVAQVVGAAPTSLNTLDEIAAAIGDDPNFAQTITNALAQKANINGNTSISVRDANGNPLLPTESYHLAVRSYVDQQIASSTSDLANSNKVINLEPPIPGSVTTDPLIANSLATIGTTNGFTINLGFGEFRETGPVVFNEKWQLQLVGPQSATTTAVTIKNGITIQNSNGVRMTRIQVEGTSSISSRAGLGMHFERCQFPGNLTLGGTGGFMMFTEVDFGGDLTIPATFAGTIYFSRCNFSKAAGVYTFSQSSAFQVICTDCVGVPNTLFPKASYSGLQTFKNNTQAYFLNGNIIQASIWQSGTTAQRPTVNRLPGQMFYDTTLGIPVFWNGSSWRNATGGAV